MPKYITGSSRNSGIADVAHTCIRTIRVRRVDMTVAGRLGQPGASTRVHRLSSMSLTVRKRGETDHASQGTREISDGTHAAHFRQHPPDATLSQIVHDGIMIHAQTWQARRHGHTHRVLHSITQSTEGEVHSTPLHHTFSFSCVSSHGATYMKKTNPVQAGAQQQTPSSNTIKSSS